MKFYPTETNDHVDRCTDTKRSFQSVSLLLNKSPLLDSKL